MQELFGHSEQAIHPAATVMLLRDSPEGVEALLVQRSSAASFLGGMWVFPGGHVDPEDAVEGGTDYDAALNAAVRETLEETGLSIPAEKLQYFAHWTTPEGAKKRFSTWFFFGIVAEGQAVEVDGAEIAEHRWVTPGRALEELADQNNPLRFLPPTLVSLTEVQSFACCSDLFEQMTARDAVLYAPRRAHVEDGLCFLYTDDAGYETSDPDLPGRRDRVYMIGDQLKYEREP